jgi:hypothetical protein
MAIHGHKTNTGIRPANLPIDLLTFRRAIKRIVTSTTFTKRGRKLVLSLTTGIATVPSHENDSSYFFSFESVVLKKRVETDFKKESLFRIHVIQ